MLWNTVSESVSKRSRIRIGMSLVHSLAAEITEETGGFCVELVIHLLLLHLFLLLVLSYLYNTFPCALKDSFDSRPMVIGSQQHILGNGEDPRWYYE